MDLWLDLEKDENMKEIWEMVKRRWGDPTKATITTEGLLVAVGIALLIGIALTELW